jgi:hypothetical protein
VKRGKERNKERNKKERKERRGTYLLTYLRSRDLLEELSIVQPLKTVRSC